MFKRYIATALVTLLAALTLTACGATKEAPAAAPAAPAAQAASTTPAPAPQVDEAAIVQEAVTNFFKTLPPTNNLIKLEDFKAKLDAGSKFYILDIRSAEDFAKGHIEGAVNAPFAKVHEKMADLPKDQPIVVVCYSGHTASQTTAALKLAGFNVSALIGGMKSWDGANLPKVQ